MTIEAYSYSEENHDVYEMIKSWSPDDFPDPNALPKLGVIAYDELGTAVAFMCADMSNNISRAYLDFLQTNPDACKFSRMRGVEMAEEFLIRELKRLDYDHIYGVTKKAGVATIAQRMGYTIAEKAFVMIYKVI